MSSIRRPAARYFVFSVSGATITGIRNLASQTGSLQIFRYALRCAGRVDCILLSLGEIDVGYIAWIRGENVVSSARLYLDGIFIRFTEFVTEELLATGLPVSVISVSHPTVESYSDWPDEAYSASSSLSLDRKSVRASLEDRIELTQYWNEKVRSWCDKNGIGWIDLTAATTTETGRVRSEWNSEHPLDHHLHRGRYATLVDSLLSASRVSRGTK